MKKLLVLIASLIASPCIASESLSLRDGMSLGLSYESTLLNGDNTFYSNKTFSRADAELGQSTILLDFKTPLSKNWAAGIGIGYTSFFFRTDLGSLCLSNYELSGRSIRVGLRYSFKK